ncbi:MAG: ABC-F family ATP-binding cassette domain-containing protein [Armatimonadetes bacterium]|nr:ABC-F family ATP-binding cassette domain-containing protein [Armatimonadota bacterium]
MSLLEASLIEKSFGANTVLDGVSLRLAHGQKIGLVGRNGCGKTTLLRILAGEEEPDRGTVRWASRSRIGYLRQEQMVHDELTVYEEADLAFEPIRQLERRLHTLEQIMSNPDRSTQLPAIVEEYGEIRSHFDWMGGYEILRDTHTVLQRLGFSLEDQKKPVSVLSGGERTQLAMARLLLSAPDALLLDEPTNHLDLEAVEWLEQFLIQFGGAMIIVSHDRIFLDRVVRRIAEMENGKLHLYSGNFSQYRLESKAQRNQQVELYERQQEEIARLEEFVRRNMGTQNTGLAKSRSKRIARIKASGVKPPTEADKIRLKLSSSRRSGNEILELRGLTHRIGDRTLFADINLLMRRGDRIGIVGPNGTGKTTLLRLITGEEGPTEGEIRIGASVDMGYYAQEAAELNEGGTVIEEMLAVSDLTPPQARSFLARFLFRGDDVYQPVAALSGGEKSRLVLAILILSRPNLLILDEPTNHLDIDVRKELTELLEAFDGSLLLVSHDRYLLNRVTRQTMVIAKGQAELFDGNYEAYTIELAQMEQRNKQAASKPVSNGNRSSAASSSPKALSPREISKARQRIVKEIKLAEERVAELEDWIKRLEEILSDPSPDDDIAAIARDYSTAQQQLEHAIIDWEQQANDATELGVAL